MRTLRLISTTFYLEITSNGSIQSKIELNVNEDLIRSLFNIDQPCCKV